MAQTLPNGVVIPEQTEPISSAGVQEMRTLGTSVDASLAGKASPGYVDAGLHGVASLVSQKHADSVSYTSAVESASVARDAALGDLIDGVEGMTYVGAWEPGRAYRINDVVAHGGDSWARLTAGSAGEPGASPTNWGLVARKGDGGGFGELSETDVTGLYDTVDNDIEARLAALEYDSGERDITSLVPDVVSGSLYLTRVGRTVWLDFNALVGTPQGSSALTYSRLLPSGFRVARRTRYRPLSKNWAADATGPVRLDSTGTVVISGAGGSQPIRGLISFPTDDPIPTTRPGSPA